MEDIANSNNIEGYDSSGGDTLHFFVYHHMQTILLSLFLLAFILMGSAVYSKIKHHKKSYGIGLALTLLLSTIFYFANFTKSSDKGIITQQGTFIMSGPSIGANLLDSPKKGSKIRIIGKEDVWLKIEWDNQTGYIKSQSVQPLVF